MPEPATLTAGDRWAWDRADLAALYPPAEGWSLTWYFAPVSGGATRTVTTSAEGFAVVVDPAATALFSAGEHARTVAVSDASGRITLETGFVAILPDPAAAEAPDARSRNARILAAIEATLEKRATADADALTIEGRSISRTPMPDLLKARARFAELVRRERGGAAVIVSRVKFT